MNRFLSVVVITLTASVAHGQTVTQHDDRTVTVRAEGIPIATLLSDIARVHSMERVTIQPGVEQRSVSIVLERVAPAAALVAILKASGLDFGVSGRRVIVGDWTGPAGPEGHPLRVAEVAAAPEDHALRLATDAAVQTAEAEQQANVAAVDNESTILPMPTVPFVAHGENITYLDPTFVPYKLRPEVRARRMAIDVAKIP